MGKITRLVFWLCRKFTRCDLQELVDQLQQVLAGGEPEFHPRDDFRQPHPHYRDFYVDPQTPLTQPPLVSPPPQLDGQQLRADYQRAHGRPLLPAACRCAPCGAPRDFLYLNDGRPGSQRRCKVWGRLSPLAPRLRPPKTRYWCPYCHSALYRWEQQPEGTIYKCPGDRCPHYLHKQPALPWNEKLLQKLRLSQFKLRYQYREYPFRPAQLQPAAPAPCPVDLTRRHRASDLLGLVLAFHISFALSARKTAQVLRQVFGVPLSYQSVLHYAQAAADYGHAFLSSNSSNGLTAPTSTMCVPPAALPLPTAPWPSPPCSLLTTTFLRPHLALGHRVPIPLPELGSVATLQGRWNKILELAVAACAAGAPLFPAFGS